MITNILNMNNQIMEYFLMIKLLLVELDFRVQIFLIELKLVKEYLLLILE